MPYVSVGRENSGDIRIYYEDHGAGPAVVLVSGYLADAHAWEKQERPLLRAGYRVITYDRRGCGLSSRPSSGYDYDTLAGDLAILIRHLDIHDAVLVGSCSGTGEVIRYLGRDGHRAVRGAALLTPVPPSPSRSHDSRAEPSFIDRFEAELAVDRPAAIKAFLDLHYNLDLLGSTDVSDQAWQNRFHVAIGISAAAALGCTSAWREDFRW